jgi:glucokinase
LLPKIAVVGIAGEVMDNRVRVTNISHWPICDGVQIQQACNIGKFKFINDFAAMGYGIDTLKEKDVNYLNKAH